MCHLKHLLLYTIKIISAFCDFSVNLYYLIIGVVVEFQSNYTSSKINDIYNHNTLCNHIDFLCPMGKVIFSDVVLIDYCILDKMEVTIAASSVVT
jgi:hypothetical protein